MLEDRAPPPPLLLLRPPLLSRRRSLRLRFPAAFPVPWLLERLLLEREADEPEGLSLEPEVVDEEPPLVAP